MSRFKIIPARAIDGAFFIDGDPAYAMKVATEVRDACEMSVVVVAHPEGGLISHVGTVVYKEPPKPVKRAA